MRSYATLTGTQWPLHSGGGVLGNDLKAGDIEITQLPGGAVLDHVEVLVTEIFNGTTPTVAVIMTEMDGSGSVTLAAAAAATAVSRAQTDLSAQAQLLTPRRVILRGAAANSTTGAAYASIGYIVPGRSNEVSD